MSPIISIPVTPFILSLFNECKENLKYADKSDCDFLIFLLNSSLHVFSIVKEFSPLLAEALMPNGHDTTSQLQELEKKSSGFCSPSKFRLNSLLEKSDRVSKYPATESDEESTGSACETDDEISLGSTELDTPNSTDDISNHFANYNKAEHPHKCPTCASEFSSKKSLYRHISNKSCYYQEKKRSPSSKTEPDSPASTTSPSKKFKCTDCCKEFETAINLKRHVKLSRKCGEDAPARAPPEPREDARVPPELLSKSLPARLEPDTSGYSYECTFCGATLSTEKTFQVHIRRFRCKRRCKICDFASGQNIHIQSHIKREHNMSLSIQEIEDYNKRLFDEHFKFEGGGIGKMLAGEFRCTVYGCKFATTHKGGLTTHINHHTIAVGKKGDQARSCGKCGVVGIPCDLFDSHACEKRGNTVDPAPTENDVEQDVVGSGGSAHSSPDSNSEDELDEAAPEDVHDVSSPIKILPSLSKRSPIVLKLKSKLSNSTPKKSVVLSSFGLSSKRSAPTRESDTEAESGKFKCKFCDFSGDSWKHVAGHMNVHKFKKPKLNTLKLSEKNFVVNQ